MDPVGAAASRVAPAPRTPQVAASPGALRREILTRLRKDGPSTPDQLATAVGASRTGVLQQLRAMPPGVARSQATARTRCASPFASPRNPAAASASCASPRAQIVTPQPSAISADAAAKPSPRVFERALGIAGVEPAEALHVGDKVDNDIEGAAAAGVRGVLLQREGDPPPEMESISSLSELPALL